MATLSQPACTRCSGAKGFHLWPGYKCYRCNGTGIEPHPRPQRKARTAKPLPTNGAGLDYTRVEYREQAGMASCLSCTRRDVASRIAAGECVHCNPEDFEF